MKLKIPAIFLCANFIAPAMAQSNITVYGIVDAGVQASNFGNGTQYNLASGIASGSRLGVKGVEDLGGGYKTIFTLESRIELDTGTQTNGYLSSSLGQQLTKGLPAPVVSALIPLLQPADVINPNKAIFDRTSMVGLITPAGAILMGRQYTPDYEIVSITDTFESGFAGGWGQILGGPGGYLTTGVAIRVNNSIQYRIGLPNGITASAMYGFEDTGALNLSNHFWGANAQYKGNGWNVGLGYNREQDQNGNTSLTSLTLGGSYAVGSAKFFAGYHRMKNDNSQLVPLAAASLGPTLAGIIGRNARLDAKSFTLGAHYRFGSGRVMASISRTLDKASDSNVTLYGVGYDYDLSKRTDVYVAVAHVANQNTAQYALGGAGYLGGFTSEPGQSGNVLQFGVRHRF